MRLLLLVLLFPVSAVAQGVWRPNTPPDLKNCGLANIAPASNDVSGIIIDVRNGFCTVMFRLAYTGPPECDIVAMQNSTSVEKGGLRPVRDAKILASRFFVTFLNLPATTELHYVCRGHR